jgi:hypothetical protein
MFVHVKLLLANVRVVAVDEFGICVAVALAIVVVPLQRYIAELYAPDARPLSLTVNELTTASAGIVPMLNPRR